MVGKRNKMTENVAINKIYGLSYGDYYDGTPLEALIRSVHGSLQDAEEALKIFLDGVHLASYEYCAIHAISLEGVVELVHVYCEQKTKYNGLVVISEKHIRNETEQYKKEQLSK